MKTGNTWYSCQTVGFSHDASMEPGHEDREYPAGVSASDARHQPQWSPVMKTGNTSVNTPHGLLRLTPQWSPVMKTGNTPPGPV